MKEDFLHYIWRFTKFDIKNLKSTEGLNIQIIDAGQINRNSGPDFSNAKIKIGNIIWLGHIEIHIQSSDWNKHKHTNDKSYESVILHVVWEDNKTIYRKNGTKIHTLELKNLVDMNLIKSYRSLLSGRGWVNCESQLHSVLEIEKKIWFNRLSIERLEKKVILLKQQFINNSNDWNETFFQSIAANFGLKINVFPFSEIARLTPKSIFDKHKNSQFQIEALVFGQAGMLEDDFNDSYPIKLQKEYSFLKHKYKLTPIKKSIWKWLRLRPASFPTIRLSQFSHLIYKSNHIFSKIIESSSPKDLEELFSVEASTYWNNHYRFDSLSKNKNPKHFGKNSITLIIINLIIPFLFLYGKEKQNDSFIQKSLDFLNQIPSEKNKIINEWNRLGIKTSTAMDSQALLQLKNEYCDKNLCLSCNIGNHVLQKTNIPFNK